MTFSPSLETVLTVLSGVAPVRARTFPWGASVEPFSVGSQGSWVVEASGVEPVHFFLGFDGRQIHVAAGSPNTRLWIGPNAVGPTWVPVPVGTELRFGEARIGVTCNEMPAQAAPYEPHPSPVPASPMRTPSRRTQVLADHRTPPPGPLAAQRQEPSNPPAPAEPALQPKAPVLGFVTVQPGVRKHDEPPAPPPPAQPMDAGHARPQGPAPAMNPAAAPTAAMRTVAIEAPRIQPTPAPGFQGVVQNPGLTVPAQHPAPNPFAGHTAVAPLGHAGVARLPSTAPIVQPGFGSGANPAQSPVQVTGAMTTAPSARRPLDQAQVPAGQTGVTVSDDGALRDLAQQVATGIAVSEGAAQDAYFAQVKKKAGTTPPQTDITPGPLGNLGPSYPPTAQPQGFGQPPPTPSPAGQVPGEAWGPPGYSASPPPNFAAEPPQITPPIAPPNDAAKPPSKLSTAWRQTSWVKKITLALLPFAAYFGLIWEPPEEPPPPETIVVSTQPGPSPTSSGPGATTKAEGPRPTTSAESKLGSKDAVTAAEPTTSAKPGPLPSSAAGALVSPGASASAAPATGPMPRDAFNAAFEGRLSEAARRYESLSKISDPRVYSLAARFAREQAVRKP